MKVVNQKLSLGFRRNNQMNVSNSCDVFVPGIWTKVGYTYGKFEINASIEYNNATVFILLTPRFRIYGTKGRISGYVDTFIFNNVYLRQQSNGGSVGISYGEDPTYELTTLDETKLSLIRSGFHVFVFEWNKMEMVWKIDQDIILKKSLNRYFKISDKSGQYAEKGQPFDHDFHLFLANQMPNGIKYQDINENFTNTQFIIDYVKYYKWNQDSKEINVSNFSNISINYYTFLIIITAIIIIILIAIFCLFIFYKIRKRNQNLLNTSVRNDMKQESDGDFQLYEHYHHNYEMPSDNYDTFVSNNYLGIQ